MPKNPKHTRKYIYFDEIYQFSGEIFRIGKDEHVRSLTEISIVMALCCQAGLRGPKT